MSFPINLEEEGDIVQQLLVEYVKVASPNDTYRLSALDLLHRLTWHRGDDTPEDMPRPTEDEIKRVLRDGHDRSYETRTGIVFTGAGDAAHH